MKFKGGLKRPFPPPSVEILEAKGPNKEKGLPLAEMMDKVEDQKLKKMKEADAKKSQKLAAKIIRELEEEITKWRRIREEQMKARRQSSKEQQGQALKTGETDGLPPLQEPPTKPKRGLIFGFWGRRIKFAQQQSQPERVGRRIGG